MTARRSCTTGALVLAMAVALQEGRARGEDAAPLGSAVELRDVSVDPDRRVGDVRGLGVDVRYRVGRVGVDSALFLVAHLEAEGGRRVASLVKSAAVRDRDGLLHGKAQLLTVPRNAWREASLFLPFFAMDLDAGPHRLALRFSALANTGACQAGRPPQRVKLVGETRAAAAFTKPPFARVRLLARRVEVAPEATDVGLPGGRGERPDLRWRLGYRTASGAGPAASGGEVVLHESEVRDDTFVGTWAEPSPPVPVSEGDRLTLVVVDRDLARDDRLGEIQLSLDELRGPGPPRLGPNGAVRAVELGPVEVVP
jgi:hypothetical protein